MNLRSCLFGATSLLLAGCDGCGASEAQSLYGAAGGVEPAPSLEIPEAVNQAAGIYEITAMTESTTGCDQEGESILDGRSERMLVVRPGTADQAAFGVMAQIVSCRDADACRASAANPMAGGEMLHYFNSASDKSLTGVDVRSGFSGGEVCTQAGEYELKLDLEGDLLSFRRRGVRLDYPSDGGMCSTGTAQKLAAGKPCNHLLALRAKRVSGL